MSNPLTPPFATLLPMAGLLFVAWLTSCTEPHLRVVRTAVLYDWSYRRVAITHAGLAACEEPEADGFDASSSQCMRRGLRGLGSNELGADDAQRRTSRQERVDRLTVERIETREAYAHARQRVGIARRRMPGDGA